MDQRALELNGDKFISIEFIQDLIEKELLKQNYIDVFDSFSSYRKRRNESRRIFISKQHKFLKAIENSIKKKPSKKMQREKMQMSMETVLWE